MWQSDRRRGLPSQFVKAVMTRWPNAILQFEDFNMAHAQPLLERYRDHHLVFNDDIQARPRKQIGFSCSDMVCHSSPCGMVSLASWRKLCLFVVGAQHVCLVCTASFCRSRSTGATYGSLTSS